MTYRAIEWVGTAAVIWFAAVGAGFTVVLAAAVIGDVVERRSPPTPELDELEDRRRRDREAWERHLAGWVPDPDASYEEQVAEHARRWRAYLRDAGTLRTPIPDRRNP